MRDTITAQLEELVKLRHEPPAEVIAEAIQVGVSKLYTESVLGKFLKKRLSRNKTIGLVGLEAVALAEKQHKAVQQDVSWGLSGR